MPLDKELQLLGSSTLTAPVSGGQVACNPAFNLTATVGDGSAVLHIWRANDNQLISKHTERNQKVEAIKWKEDGHFLAAGWSDGVVRLVGLESSKAVHHIRVAENGALSKIDFIAWSRNAIGRRTARESPASASALAAWSILADDDQQQPHVLDLAHELTFLEIETALPKLSPLPVSGGSGDDMFLFSTTASLEFVFRPCPAEDANVVHVMIIGTADGGIHLSIYDSFVIGTFKHSPRTAGPASGSGVFQLCGHGSHHGTSTHTLLLRPQGGDGTVLYLVPMDLVFVHYSPVNLSLLASKMTMMQNLLRYLKQTQSHMTSEWKSTRELPARFLLGVQEDLQKTPRGGLTIFQALYHTVATGHAFPPVKEWLVDSLAERGHKRWDKAVVSGLENLRGLVHENFIPALERCGIILSRLLGIARFHDSRESIGFNAAQISRLMDIVSCLTVVSHRILLIVMDELEYFTSFSTWLRLEIDRAASPSMSDDLTEKEVMLDDSKVLSYIEQYLIGNPLALYFDEVTKEDYAKDQDLAEDGVSLLQMLDKQLSRKEAGLPYMKALPHLDFLVKYLTSRANTVFRDIAEAEKRGVRFGQATELSFGQKIWNHEIRLCSKPRNSDVDATAFTAIVLEADKSGISLFRTIIPIINGISGVASTTACRLLLPEGFSLIDLKFLDDESLLALCQRRDELKPVLLRIAYRATAVLYGGFRNTQALVTVDLEHHDLKKVVSSFTFPHISGFVPTQMEVQTGSKARGEIPARVCLLGRDKATYVYKLPESWDVVPESPLKEDVRMEGS
ncbi:anaphase-promoting complex, cyclosome, subunit 4-domain-containing protein [Lasiosphaeria miniovina]|uniref:Anaphase-promoting complex subunit 4 n=1 Tax=Lasiosphaeria miniovina TaxID=1954250 RepID=A0AA40E2P6_9PEZI|nr:anaphase-promoting complex, cyclosome, subunit 4-domain-containing protein [Lasiosphaeria miniovina]KAK0722752.1 anaphase-promoting complex, cyclosome, subunit 4-domain-containing protein [Lasiosphaeria miniovina]